MNLKQLKKYIERFYWKNEQQITLDTFEVRDGGQGGYDICLYESKKKEKTLFLYTVNNYHSFYDLNSDVNRKSYSFFDSIAVASKPYYINREFLVRKWTPITDEDILTTGKYFIFEVLDLRYVIWNIDVKKETEEEFNEEENKLYF